MRILIRIASSLLVSGLVSGPVLSLSIFDVLQLTEKGYGSEEIISLIEATDSLFELEAEDLPKLKELGVDERVIRAMLQRVPAEGPGGLSGGQPDEIPPDDARESVSHSEDDHGDAHETPDRGSELGTSSTPGPASIPATTPLVSTFDFEEERSGGHRHAAIAISGVEVLILRDEGSFPSIEARAREIVRRLDDAWALGDGAFYRGPRDSGPSVDFQSVASRQRITVLDVTAADARTYEIRSGREVSRELLASYWADLLTDFGALTAGRAPKRATSLHSGEALGVLYQALRSSQGKGGGLRTAADLMPSSPKHHLESLAIAVPRDYEPRTMER